MSRKIIVAACMLAASMPWLFAQTTTNISSETRDTITRIESSSLIDGRAYEYDQQLADGIGARLTGSANYEKAVQWATNLFRSLGLENVHTENFSMPNVWEPEVQATGRILTPREQTLHIASFGWSPSTPETGIHGTVYYIKDLTAADKLNADGQNIRGKIALIDRYSFGNGPVMLWGRVLGGYQVLKDLGAQAVLFGGSTSNEVESMMPVSVGGALCPLPAANLGQEDFALLRRLSEKGPITIEFSFKNRIRGPVEVHNVVAEIRGSEKPEQWVLVGAHLDSWHPGTGAQDNGTGVAEVIEAARAIKSAGRAPRHSIRFVLFGGEEQVDVGSQAYVKSHVDELANCIAVLVSDSGDEAAHGWLTFGREDVDRFLQPVEPLLAGLGGDGVSPDADHIFDTDNAPFLLQGIPTLVLWTEFSKYMTLHHKPGDTFDKVDKRTLTQGAAIVAATVYAVADEQTFAGRLTQEQTEELLKKTNKYEEYKNIKEHGLL